FAAYTGFKTARALFYDVALQPDNTSKVEIVVNGDETDTQMGQTLKDLGCIDDLDMYKWRCKIYSAEYKAGTYKVSPSFTTEKIINILSGYDYSDSNRMSED
ncbi:MAG: hypothetical protein HUJ75_04835, partial [Parasporobacterium sp.]|nr:hypothetical protein [Parasporobacterium sp.]